MYGVAVTGLNEDMITQVRRTAACGTTPYASGRSLDITVQLTELDPVPAATGAPLVRWAQEIWQSALHAAIRKPCRAIPAQDLVRMRNHVHEQPPKDVRKCVDQLARPTC